MTVKDDNSEVRKLSNEQVELLPNPHLRYYLDASVFDLDDADREKAYRAAYLQAAHLPPNYDSLDKSDQFKARWATLTSWYDPAVRNELCSNVDNLIAAHFLWVEWYLKPDPSIGGLYFHKDSRVKYDIVRAVMSPPKIESEPAKTVIHCPRGTTKTMTVIRELCSMMALVRPYTKILVSEINKDRTSEEMLAIRQIYEDCELIKEDFGGKGTLYSTSFRQAHKWSERQLDVLIQPSCSIMGYSAKSRQRGRHPIFGVIDDPEDEDTVTDAKFRQKFMHNLFRRYMGMFYRGGKIAWVGTVIRNSCLQIALKDLIQEPMDLQDMEENYDERFQSWNKVHFGMIQTDAATGERFSIMSDHTSVAGYDLKKRTMGAATVAAELDGRPVAEGKYALIRDEYRHGFMHCVRQPGQPRVPDEYMLDLKTGEILPWREFLDGLFIASGLDPADSTSSDADYGANAVVGVSADGVFFFLDIYVKRMISDEWPQAAFTMCAEWEATRQGIEVVAQQKPIFRRANALRVEYEAQGKFAPTIIPVRTNQRSKNNRLIATYRPLYTQCRIRFPKFDPVTLANGTTHVPLAHPNRRSFRELFNELDGFTDDGAAGHDDAMDGGAIAIETVGRMRGVTPMQKDDSEINYEKWLEIGVDWESRPEMIPPEAWSDRLKEKMQADEFTGIEADELEMDPYAYS